MKLNVFKLLLTNKYLFLVKHYDLKYYIYEEVDIVVPFRQYYRYEFKIYIVLYINYSSNILSLPNHKLKFSPNVQKFMRIAVVTQAASWVYG